VAARDSHVPHEPVEALLARAKDAAAKGLDDQAEQLLRRALALDPACLPAYVDLASLLCRAGRAEAMLALLDGVLTRQPRTAWALSLKAAVLETDRRVEEALEVHEALVARAPNASVPWLNYGNALQATGRVDEAVAAYRRALAQDPSNGFAWWGLANLRTVPLSAGDVAEMERALPRSADPLGRAQLHFALGKALGDVGRFEESFRQYAQGNSARARLVAYDPRGASDLARHARATFTPAFLAKRTGQGCDAPDPIFIVGMPRSGSTLVEQILASHPLVEALGELPVLQNIAGRISGETDAGQGWPEAVAGLGAAELRALGERYLADTRRLRRTGRPFFTDKMPSNWRYLGLIHAILPNAKIVDVRRDPLACCFSAFTTYFNRETRFPTSLEDLGRYYRDYTGLADSFAAARPARVHRLRYERLVDDLEDEVRRLLAYLGLPFDEACLRFHESRRAIHTPSAQQVREPINRKGLGRWRAYEPWLAPLMRGLRYGEPLPGIAVSSHFRRSDRSPSFGVLGECVSCLGEVR
jgi:Tfp pilus assembly protein PilF